MELNLLTLLLLILAAWLAGAIANRLGLPAVLGELLAGILLGPPLLNILPAGEALPALRVLADIGILLMMLYVGLEVTPTDLSRATRSGLAASLLGFFLPAALGVAVMWNAGHPLIASAFVGMALGVTSLAVNSRILADLKLLDTRVAHMMVSGAVIADTLSLLVFAAILGYARSGGPDPAQLGLVAGKALLFFALAMFIGLRMLPVLGGLVGARQVTHGFLLTVAVALLFAEMAELAGLHGVLGTFLAGLFFTEKTLDRRVSHQVHDLIRAISVGFLAPLYFVMAGYEVTFAVFGTQMNLFLGIMAAAIVGKILGTLIPYLLTGYGWREGLVVGAGMNSRGAVEIIIAGIGLRMGLIDTDIFSILVFMAILTTAMVPMVLTTGIRWLEQRGELVRTEEARQGVLIVGASGLARELAQLLAKSQPVTLLDMNELECIRATEAGLHALQGDALDDDILADAGAGEVRTLIACTGNEGVNALVARLAASAFRVPEIRLIATKREKRGHESSIQHLGAGTLFGQSVDLAEWNWFITQDRIERVPVAIEEAQSSEIFAERLLETAPEQLPMVVVRDLLTFPFASTLHLETGDRVICLRRL